MSLTTRPAAIEDIEFLAVLFLSSMRESITAARGYWDPTKEDKQFRQQLELEHTRVIQIENADIGFVTARYGTEVILVGTLCISVGHQGSGIGTQIMRQLIEDAVSAKLAVELFVLKANQRAMALYARLGFVEIEELAHHVRMRWEEAAG